MGINLAGKDFYHIKLIAIGISVIAAVVSAVMYYIDQKQQKYNQYQLPIPEVLVDYDVENEAGGMLTYHVVKWNKTRVSVTEEKCFVGADRPTLNLETRGERVACSVHYNG